MELKVGDKVAWEGQFFHSYKENVQKISDDTSTIGLKRILENNINYEIQSGENAIIKIDNVIKGIDFYKTMVELDNGKIFSIDEVTLITE